MKRHIVELVHIWTRRRRKHVKFADADTEEGKRATQAAFLLYFRRHSVLPMTWEFTLGDNAGPPFAHNLEKNPSKLRHIAQI